MASFSIFTPRAFAETDINGDIISTDTTWIAANGPYVIYDTPTIEIGATLTIEPGTIVKFDILSGIDVSGTLIADGTADNKIYFTSLMDDSVGGDTDDDGGLFPPSASDWDGFNITPGGSYEI